MLQTIQRYFSDPVFAKKKDFLKTLTRVVWDWYSTEVLQWHDTPAGMRIPYV